MIELHSHILHGMDDGPETLSGSVRLARIYERAGFRVVVATPHFVQGTPWAPHADTVESRVGELNAILRKKSIDIEILTGMEIGMDPSIPALLEEKKLLTLAGSSYLLLEVPFQALPMGWERLIFQLRTQGSGVILAHPERCAQLIHEPETVLRMLQIGCAIQVNWGSLTGSYGQQVAACARHLVTRGWLHCLATDSHDAMHRHPDIVSEGMRMLRSITSQDNADILASRNPARVLKSESLEDMSVEPRTPAWPRRWFQSFFQT